MTNEKYYTSLDIHLQNLAAADWPAFVQIVGEDNITKAKICVLKSKGKSISQIANRLQITKHQAEYNRKNCPKCSEAID